MSDVPFETMDDGGYAVRQPFKDVEPEQLTITVNDTTYEFSDFQGKATRSRIYHETLVYGECEVGSGE